MTNTFAVHLGGGAYLDATGNIVFAAPPKAQIYQTPDGLRVDANKLLEIFKDLAGLLPSTEEPKTKWALCS